MNPNDYTRPDVEIFHQPIPEPAPLTLLALAAVLVTMKLYWPLVKPVLVWLGLALFFALPVLLICVIGLLADIVGWDWLGDKCAAWIGEEPDPGQD